MKLIDSNIVIYAGKPGFEFLHPLLAEPDVAVSVITQVETLGYHQLGLEERQSLAEFFANVECLPLTQPVIEKAIALRQARRMPLADSLIAATALTHGAVLVTHNVQDFRWMEGLALLDPVGPRAGLASRPSPCSTSPPSAS